MIAFYLGQILKKNDPSHANHRKPILSTGVKLFNLIPEPLVMGTPSSISQ